MTAPDQASPTGQDSPPTCYRHPSKETWVSCVRCGRYACPDCLREAAVGQQCVECVRGAGRTTRQAKTAFGGRPAATTAVTWTLVAVNVVIFLVEVAKPNLLYEWGMLGVPALTPAGPQAGVAGGDWYRLLTSAFTAPGTSFGGLGFLDIAVNMWALIVVGPPLERLLGHIRFLAVYLLSGIGGSVLTITCSRTASPPARPVPSSACSVPGSWYRGSSASTLDRSSFSSRSTWGSASHTPGSPGRPTSAG